MSIAMIVTMTVILMVTHGNGGCDGFGGGCGATCGGDGGDNDDDSNINSGGDSGACGHAYDSQL